MSINALGLVMLMHLYSIIRTLRPVIRIQRGIYCFPVTDQEKHRSKQNSIIETRTWWRHQMETFSALLAFCAGNWAVTGEFPSQRPVTMSFDVSFDLRLYKRLSKHAWGWSFETPSRSLWRHCNDILLHRIADKSSHIWDLVSSQHA